MRGKELKYRLLAAVVCVGWAATGFAAGPSCTAALGAPAITRGLLKTVGKEATTTQVAAVPGHTYLVQVDERGNDAWVEVLDSQGLVIARADHPERRTGTRRAVITASVAVPLLLRVTGKERTGLTGTASVALYDLAVLADRPDCRAALNSIAEADAQYAAGQQTSTDHSGAAPSAHESYLRSAQAYKSAERGFGLSGDLSLQGQAALAVAAVEYYNLQDWQQAADWAQSASKSLVSVDAYRSARADALLAAAWIEIGSSASAGRAVTGTGADENDLLTRARHLLQHLADFHLKRGERYDAGLQLANIGLSYLNEGRYQECVTASAEASLVFGSINELLRRALAWQNRALCLWGLGQLPEALRWFDRALTYIGPEPYPTLYVGAVTNTALAYYAVGRLDESLRLYDRALVFNQKLQAPRDEAYCLYGLGVNYYALGDRQRAREYLERSLAIRTVALDGRGRMASLRALATIDAEQGRVQQALAADQEALELAIAPPTVGRIKVQQAAHTAAADRPTEAKRLLDQVLATAAMNDPQLKAEALLQRAMLLRSTGNPGEALKDLDLARPALHDFGSVVEEFEADLELARALREVGQPKEALAAVDRALEQSDAVRLQTANPELRAQLQTPLRPAYDLKLELLRDQFEEAQAAGREAEASAIATYAFATADAARAHTFADVASQKYSPKVRRELTGEFRDREDLYRELASRRFALDARLEHSAVDDPRVRQLMAEIAELRRKVDAVNTVIANHSSAGGDAAAHGRRERPSIPALGADTALISYWLASGSAYAWVVLPGEIHWTRLGPPREIANQAVAFHHSLTRLVDVPVERRLENSAALYAMILRPLEGWLSPVRNWVIIPDGALDYVPFPALQSGPAAYRSFVALEHDVAVTPAAWMLDTGPRRVSARDAGKILLVADPVYQADDPRLRVARTAAEVKSQTPQAADEPLRREFRRLPFTAREAAGIAAQFKPADVEQLVGVAATRQRLLALDWSQYRFIHIATHGVVDAQVPALSALVLGSYDAGGRVSDREVRVADIALERLTAEVAVLSACETALGTEVRSEGLVGMSSTMLARGARAVVASLWPVPDQIGARLMTNFYQQMLRNSMAPQAALSAVMRSMATAPQSADPALWAAFQVSVVGLGTGAAGRAAEPPAAARRAAP